MSEETALAAVARAYVWVLSGHLPVSASNAHDLEQARFSGTFPRGEDFLRRAIAELPLTRGVRLGPSQITDVAPVQGAEPIAPIA